MGSEGRGPDWSPKEQKETRDPRNKITSPQSHPLVSRAGLGGVEACGRKGRGRSSRGLSRRLQKATPEGPSEEASVCSAGRPAPPGTGASQLLLLSGLESVTVVCGGEGAPTIRTQPARALPATLRHAPFFFQLFLLFQKVSWAHGDSPCPGPASPRPLVRGWRMDSVTRELALSVHLSPRRLLSGQHRQGGL